MVPVTAGSPTEALQREAAARRGVETSRAAVEVSRNLSADGHQHRRVCDDVSLRAGDGADPSARVGKHPYGVVRCRHAGALWRNCVGPLIQAGQWWRLVTGAFVHVTILHIALNMWCLWNLGIFGEPLLGKRGLVAVYLLTGTTGMMFSYAWSVASGQVAFVAGASGAVFGIAGILIVLLSNRKLQVPWEELRSLRRQVIFFASRTW